MGSQDSSDGSAHRVELKNAQLTYKKDFDRRLRRANANIKVGEHVWLDVEDGMAKENLGLYTEGTLPVLDRKKRAFVIQHSDVVKRVNSDHVGWAPAPTATEAPYARRQLEDTHEYLARNNRGGNFGWLRR